MWNWLSAWKLPALVALAAAAACLEAEAGGRQAKTFLSFHVEAEAVEEGKMVERIRLGNRDYFFRKVPEFTNEHIEAFYPFPAENGKSYGAAFKMTKVGTQRLAVVTQSNLDRRLLTAVQQSPISFVIIDAPIRDGVIVVWSGLTEQHLALFEKSLKRGEMEGREDPASQDMNLNPVAGEGPAAEPAPQKRRRLFDRFRKKDGAAAEATGAAADFADPHAPVPQ